MIKIPKKDFIKINNLTKLKEYELELGEVLAYSYYSAFKFEEYYRNKFEIKAKNKNINISHHYSVLWYLFDNFAIRIYMLRERLCHLVNIALDIGLDEKDVRFGLILRNKKVVDRGIDKIFKQFERKPICKILSHRNSVTHNRGTEEKNKIDKNNIEDIKKWHHEKSEDVHQCFNVLDNIIKEVKEKIELNKINSECKMILDSLKKTE